MGQQLVLVLIAAGAVLLMGILVLIARTWRQVDQGRAMIVNKMGNEPKVTFTGAIVLPIVNRAEIMDLSVKTIDVSRRGKEGLICADNIRADIKVTFFVRVNKTVDDVLRVAQSIGCVRASQQSTFEELFLAKFSEALKTVGKQMEFEQLYTQRDHFKDRIIQVIGKDLNGYVLDDCAIDFLEQTPMDVLDPQNVLDALGIRKITEITTSANIDTNQLKQRERMELGKQNLTSDEAIFRFEQQRAEAEAKKLKEIAIATARETNEASRFQVEEEKRTHVERQRADEAIQMAEQAKLRSVQVSEQGRIREVEVEKVRVSKAHDLEEVGRQREVELTSNRQGEGARGRAARDRGHHPRAHRGRQDGRRRRGGDQGSAHGRRCQAPQGGRDHERRGRRAGAVHQGHQAGRGAAAGRDRDREEAADPRRRGDGGERQGGARRDPPRRGRASRGRRRRPRARARQGGRRDRAREAGHGRGPYPRGAGRRDREGGRGDVAENVRRKALAEAQGREAEAMARLRRPGWRRRSASGRTCSPRSPRSRRRRPQSRRA